MKTESNDRTILKFATEEDGAATPLAIFFCLIFLVLGGLAVDYNKAMSERARLQIAADSAAHAALYTRENESVEDSVQAALATIDGMLPAGGFGNGVLSSDVEFGVWDPDTRQFAVDASSRSAARVFAEMTPERDNPSRTILLSMIGMDTISIGTNAVYTHFYPPCFREGFVADDVVDIQSGNSYLDGFCIHSNTHVSLNSNNFFEPGTVVSMPDLDRLDMPQSGMDSNEGLDAALRAGKYRQKLLNRLPQRLANLRNDDILDIDNNLTEEGRMATLTNPPLVLPVALLPGRKVNPAVFAVPGIYHLTCNGGGNNAAVTFEPGVYGHFIFETNCIINLQSNGSQVITMHDVVLATTNNDAESIKGEIVQLGLNDGCSEGGGVIFMSMGGVKFSSDLSAYNAQILARGDIEFSANADGIEGVSFVSNGVITGTSSMNMGFCDGGGTANFIEIPFLKLVN